MRRCLVASLLLATGAAGFAQGDALSQPACQRAIAQLHRAEAAPQPQPALDAARRQVEQQCLRSGRDPAPAEPAASTAQRRPMPPLSVAPIRSMPMRPAPSIAPTPPAVPQPLTTTGCDAAGCWASDGSRLPRATPGANTLLGPRGLCTPHGATLVCTP